jgi:adenine phosphoribosyltransferase
MVRFALAMDISQLRAKIRDIKDFPTEGILYKDITTLLQDGPAWASVIDHLAASYQSAAVDVVVGVESRGFIFGGALAHQLGAGFVPVRKRGKLPSRTIEEEYELEYGRDVLAIHEDAIRPASACSRWMICSPPAARWRRPSDSSSGWAARSSEWRF